MVDTIITISIMMIIISDQSEADHGWFLLQRLIITLADSPTGASLISNCQTNDDDLGDDGGHEGHGDDDQGDDDVLDGDEDD